MNTSTATPDSYYERIDEHRYKPTPHAGGAWSSDEQHFSPLGGLIVHAVERQLADRVGAAMSPSRISFDILGRPALDECEIRVETVRPGRTIELVEATVLIAGRSVARARVWLLADVDTSAVAGGGADRLTAPDTLAPWPMDTEWPGGYIASLDVRPLAPPSPAAPPPGSPPASAWSPGRARARWPPTSRWWTRPTASRCGSRRGSGCSRTSI